MRNRPSVEPGDQIRWRGCGRVSTHTYDAARRRTSSTDGRGITIERTYDKAGRVTRTTSPEGAITTTYDRSGRRASVTDPHGTTTFTYDALGGGTPG